LKGEAVFVDQQMRSPILVIPREGVERGGGEADCGEVQV
jgi:hypothetical protein